MTIQTSELPTMMSSSMDSTGYQAARGYAFTADSTMPMPPLPWNLNNLKESERADYKLLYNAYAKRVNDMTQTSASAASITLSNPPPQVQALPAKPRLRIVEIFLVDPDDRVPVDKRVLKSTGRITTDATDQELFYELPVKELLECHNAFRATVTWEEEGSDNKATKTRIGLKPIRVRDLRMSVVNVAVFQ